MTAPSKAADYITRQLYTQKNIVTYRSLSRALGIHVNSAKNELAHYLANGSKQPTRPVATYLVSGSIARVQKSGYDDTMDVDAPPDEEDDGFSDSDADDAEQATMILARDEDLEDVKAEFATIYCVHLYSLSPAPIHDAGLLTAPTAEVVRKIDAEKDHAFAETVGRIISPAVKNAPPIKDLVVTPAAPTKTKSNPRAAPGLKPKLKLKEEPKLKAKQDDVKDGAKDKKSKEVEEKAKPKATGKIEFKKNEPEKTKESDKKGKGKDVETKEPAKEDKPKKVNFFAAPSLKKSAMKKAAPAEEEEEEEEQEAVKAKGKKAPTAKSEAQRGQKRKSETIMVSDDESEGEAKASSSKKPVITRVGPPIHSKKLKEKKVEETKDDGKGIRAKVDAAQAKAADAKAAAKAADGKAKAVDRSAKAKATDTKPQGGRLRNRRVVDSDEEEDEAPAKTTRRKSAVASDDERRRELEQMMDVDDDTVIHASRLSKGKPRAQPTDDEEDDDEPAHVPETEPSEAATSEPESEPEPAQQESDAEDDVDMGNALDKTRRKRKAKANVPVGRNGLKKRKVTRSRMAVDAKGFTVTEDYSSYESVDEDEADAPSEAEEPKPKGKGRAKAKTKAQAESEDEGVVVVKKGASKKAVKEDKEVKKDTKAASKEKAAPKDDKATSKPKAAPKKAAAAKEKQKTMMNFFQPTKKS
ncbi:DNA polymerase subunit Cdc27-domain-containing protein [Schizophyllum amplum]|uniref:DNA polymerase delta subunit 3 n=1 Tax=Schizophyllum amplum TaxID=97359 RepID=A0A550CL67_9AGAR|nr:DNA polymerase subunit Cdc27-domain-containing protein [Auriculariopsis ampla]